MVPIVTLERSFFLTFTIFFLSSYLLQKTTQEFKQKNKHHDTPVNIIIYFL